MVLPFPRHQPSTSGPAAFLSRRPSCSGYRACRATRCLSWRPRAPRLRWSRRRTRSRSTVAPTSRPSSSKAVRRQAPAAARRSRPAPARQFKTARRCLLRRRWDKSSRPSAEQTTARPSSSSLRRRPIRHGDDHRDLRRRVEDDDGRDRRRGRQPHRGHRQSGGAPRNRRHATIVASVQDAQGNGLLGVPVSFSTSAGTLSATTVRHRQRRQRHDATHDVRAATVTASRRRDARRSPARSTSRSKPESCSALTAPTTRHGQRARGIYSRCHSTGRGTTLVKDVVVDFGDGTKPVPLGQISSTTPAPAPICTRQSGSLTMKVTATDPTGQTDGRFTAGHCRAAFGGAGRQPHEHDCWEFDPLYRHTDDRRAHRSLRVGLRRFDSPGHEPKQRSAARLRAARHLHGYRDGLPGCRAAAHGAADPGSDQLARFSSSVRPTSRNRNSNGARFADIATCAVAV